MTIETKYNIGDEVWAMHENRPWKGSVTEINATVVHPEFYSIDYEVKLKDSSFEAPIIVYVDLLEGLVFRTKEELIKSL